MVNRFYQESLPTLVSYLSGRNVVLGDRDTVIKTDTICKFEQFEAILLYRHLLSLSKQLINAIKKIEGNYSSKPVLRRENSRGAIRGKLDTNRYISQRYGGKRILGSYPVICSSDSYDTPENILAKGMILLFSKKLNSININQRNAEYIMAQRYRRELSFHAKSMPWSETTSSSNVKRLYLETSRRVKRRQTGNEIGYSELLELYKLVSLDYSVSDSTALAESIRNINLAFPVDQSFNDRIFEIWCLNKVAYLLESLGCTPLCPVKPLYERRKVPIYSFKYKDDTINLWFQKGFKGISKSIASNWSYDDSDEGLAGIPDITVECSRGYFLLIDAKNRIVSTGTRSEETYKMLGYYENFKDTLADHRNWASLIFVTQTKFYRGLTGKDGNRMILVGAHENDSTSCMLDHRLQNFLSDWLKCIHS